MRLRSLREGEGRPDAERELALLDPAEHVAGASDEVLARRGVVEQLGRVRKSEPLAFSTWGSNAPTGPLDAP